MYRKHLLGIGIDLPGHRSATLVLGLALMQGISAQPSADPSAPVVFLAQGWTPAERAWWRPFAACRKRRSAITERPWFPMQTKRTIVTA